jgi:sugar phosphate permease
LKLKDRWSYSYTVLLLCWFGWIAIYLSRSVLAPVLPTLIVEMELTHAQGGLLETAYLIGYIIIKIPAGVIANRIGMKRTLVIGMLGYAIATALNFLAAGFAHLLALRFLTGLFQGVHLPLANTLLSERFGERQARAIGFHESGPNVGNTLVYPLTVAIASGLGWRHAFLLLSLPGFVLALVTTLVLKKEGGPLPQGGKGLDERSTSRLRDYLWLLAPLALAHVVYNICLRSLLIFTPSFLVEARGMDLAAAGLISALMPAAGFFAKVSSGFVSEVVGSRRAIIGASALTGLFTYTLSTSRGSILLSLNFVVLGLVLYSFSPVIYSSVTSGLRPGLKAVGLGAVTMVGNIGGAVSTSVIGHLIDTTGYQSTFAAISATVLIAALIMSISMRDRSE